MVLLLNSVYGIGCQSGVQEPEKFGLWRSVNWQKNFKKLRVMNSLTMCS